MSSRAANAVVLQAPHGMAGDPGIEQMQVQMGIAYADPVLQHHHSNTEGRISDDTEDLSQMGQYHHNSSGGGGSALLGRKHAPDRRPLRFWQPFNDWWRAELERLGRRPTSQEIGEWYGLSADMVWGETKPSLQETRVHAKCLRSLPLVRDYFRNYRAKKKAKNGDGSGVEGTEDGGDTEDGNDNGAGRRRRNNTRKREYNHETQEDTIDPARVAAAMAAAGMAGMDPVEIMQMQQHAGMMLPGQFWAGMEGCTDEEYARAVLMHQHMHSATLQQQMAVAAAAVAAQQFPGHQFGVFPTQDEEEEEEESELGDGAAAAAANAPAEAGAPEVFSAPAAAAAQNLAAEQTQQQQSERRIASSAAQECLQLAVPQVEALLATREFDREAAARVLAEAAAAAAAEHMTSAQGYKGRQQENMVQLKKQTESSPVLQPRTEEFTAAAVAAAAAAVAAAADAAVAKRHESSIVPSSAEAVRNAIPQAVCSTGAHSQDLHLVGVPEGASCVVRFSDAEPCMLHSQHKVVAAQQGADIQNAKSSPVGLHRLVGNTADAAVSRCVAAAAGPLGEMQSPGSTHEQAMQHGRSMAADGVVAEQPAISPTPQHMQQQQQPVAAIQAEAPRLAEHEEVSLMDGEQLEHLDHAALLAHVKQVQGELVSKRELLKRSFEQLRRTQERLGRRERKLAKEQQKCKQYQQALAAWQASLVPGCAAPDAAQMQQQQRSQDLTSVQMAQVAMAAQAAAAQGSIVQQHSQH